MRLLVDDDGEEQLVLAGPSSYSHGFSLTWPRARGSPSYLPTPSSPPSEPRILLTVARPHLIGLLEAVEILSDQIDLNAEVVWSCVQQIAGTWRNPPGTVDDVSRSLERCGLLRSVAELRSL